MYKTYFLCFYRLCPVSAVNMRTLNKDMVLSNYQVPKWVSSCYIHTLTYKIYNSSTLINISIRNTIIGIGYSYLYLLCNL
jgi:hypothetical protein